MLGIDSRTNSPNAHNTPPGKRKPHTPDTVPATSAKNGQTGIATSPSTPFLYGTSPYNVYSSASIYTTIATQHTSASSCPVVSSASESARQKSPAAGSPALPRCSRRHQRCLHSCRPYDTHTHTNEHTRTTRTPARHPRTHESCAVNSGARWLCSKNGHAVGYHVLMIESTTTWSTHVYVPLGCKRLSQVIGATNSAAAKNTASHVQCCADAWTRVLSFDPLSQHCSNCLLPDFVSFVRD